ncbi:MAG: methionine--tRNA ligase [Candidatus Parvarchaeota archaeon]|nr:methionine--tRNA ligase [Candidatus Parvarchaeota archaeon]MCW1301752.1 methionine--tRNA ligase [Candidatus Parvarchaeota archaeon]
MGKFYITTPIFYVNDKPHIGHAYTAIIADVIARWRRLSGDEVFFLTGTDEHGEKIQRAAEAKHLKPKEFVDEIVKKYKEAWEKLNISYNKFIRTTDKEHEEAVNKFIERIYRKGDIYRGEYEGWYCVPDETFLADSQLIDGKCPVCGREVKKVKEEAYFFKLSKYRDKLLEFYGKNPDFIMPKFRMVEMENRLKGDVKDLDITRRSISWAIPFEPDKTHSVYVWVDALTNYISALGWPDGDLFKKFWPADVHIIGKEINWFHSVIWPSLLMSAGLELPKKVMVHGWLTVDGQKMSKSLGNVVDPVQIADKYSTDALRYFLIRSVKLGEDSDFSEKELISKINGELVSNLGNLLSRTLSLYRTYFGRIKGEVEIKCDVEKICSLMDGLMLYEALDEILKFVKDMNKYIAEKEPWKLEAEKLKVVLYNLLEGLRILSILIYPFMPETALEISRQLNVKLGTRADLKFKEVDYAPKRGRHLFKWVK